MKGEPQDVELFRARMRLDARLDAFDQFAESLEAWLDSEEAAWVKIRDEKWDELSDYDQGECIDRLDFAQAEFRSMARDSLCMTIMAYAEHHMEAKLCTLKKKMANHGIALLCLPNHTKKRRGLDRLHDGFKELSSTWTAFCGRPWQKLKAYSMLRNTIAHSNGSLSEGNKRKIDCLEKDECVKLTEVPSQKNYRFEMTRKAPGDLVETLRKFLELLHKDIRAKIFAP